MIEAYSADDVRMLIRHECEKAGSQRKFCQAIGVSDGHLSDVLSGRRDPSPQVLAALGLVRQVTYAAV